MNSYIKGLILTGIFVVLFLFFPSHSVKADTCLPEAACFDALIDPTRPGTVAEVQKIQDNNNLAFSEMRFPTSYDPIKINGSMYAGKVYLINSIYNFRRATGSFPSSMQSLVNSGFLLFWPRNLLDGSPVAVLASRSLKEEKNDIGFIGWSKLDDSNASLDFLRLDWKTYENQGEEQWIFDTKQFEFFTYDRSQLNDLTLRNKISKNATGACGATTVVGGVMPINMVSDPEKRFIYGMCGALSDGIIVRTRAFYRENLRFPQNTSELFSPSPYKEMEFLIVENFQNLSGLLKKRNADFKIGFNYDKSVHYTFLSIDDEVLITYCSQYGDSDHEPYNDCNMNDLDMSTPMISTANIGSLEIPSEITISIKDIPLSE